MPITDGYPENQRIPSMKLNQLQDVDTGVPVDGDHLVWNEAEGEWQSEQPPAEYDPNAIHDNENNELALIPYKPTPVAEDIILIEDSEAENAKKVISLGQLFGQVNPGAVVSGGGCTVGDDGYTYCVYTSDGTATFTTGGLIEILLVGGGGGGGGAFGDGAGGSDEEGPGGGGGGGEVKYLTGVEVSATSYAITVGAGGAGGAKDGFSATQAAAGENGGATSVAGLGTAVGGGGGGSRQDDAKNGASGGGAGYNNNPPGTGSAGGDGGTADTSSPFHAGGGGGAGEDGASAGAGSHGGDGVYVDVFSDWGDSGWFGGGGGGGEWGAGQTSGDGGQGGGGGTNSAGLNGSPNTGGGGGGRGNTSFDFGGAGGNGGSGVVILRIPPTGNIQIGGPQTPGEGTPLEVTDDDAVHVDTAGEITAVTAKTEVSDCDTLLIEDCDDGDAKKSVTVSDLVSSPAVVAALQTAGLSTELLMQDGVTNPPVPLETEAQDDWLYAD